MEKLDSIYSTNYLIICGIVALAALIASWIRLPYLKQFPSWLRFRIWYRFQLICKHPLVAGGYPSFVVVLAFVYEFHTRLPYIGDWLAKHESLIGWLTIICLPLLILVSIVSATSEGGNEGYVRRLTGYLLMASDVVNAKSDRLIDTVVPNAVCGAARQDCFVDPIEQIRTIFNHATRFLEDQYKLGKDQINITVVGRVMPGGTWAYLYAHQTNWDQTPAHKLMSKRACIGRKCLKTSHPSFHASKIKAANNKEYFLSERDNDHKGIGSVYCVPFKFSLKNPKKSWEYAITVVTYGKQFCDEYDGASENEVTTYLEEICRRIQIELLNGIVRTTANPQDDEKPK